ncbi:MAG: ERAP1-like C-terminal domain-containing protein [Chloracidobacterium sp.]|nr:ERAP1-like C-terminal domain-containing protein [Chloracidobacterium sp.]
MRLLIFIVLFSVTAFSQIPAIEPGVSQDLAKWRAANYSNISYKLNLTLEKMSPVLRGSMEIHVTQAATACAEPNCPPMAIILDWRKIPGHEKESTISNVTINGQPAGLYDPLGEDSFWPTYQEVSDHLIFSRRRAVHGEGVKMGENVIKLDFTSPILTSGSAITRYVDKEDGAEYIYSLFVPSDASTAFPVFDQPDLKARFSVTVAHPAEWKVVSNELVSFHLHEVGRNTEGPCPPPCELGAISQFHETKPISTYVFAFAAGRFEEFNYPIQDPNDGTKKITSEKRKPFEKWVENDVSGLLTPAEADRLEKERIERQTRNIPSDSPDFGNIYVRRSQAAKFKPHAAEVFRLNREAVKYLETYFDYKFPFPKYDLVLIPEFPFGGMEHAGATFLREQSVIFPQEPTKNDIISRANLIFHEAAHQWFGDTVTMKWFDDLWLKEGFATFMAYKALDKIMPEANAWKVFYERVKQAAYQTDSTRGTTAIYQPIANLNSAKSAYGNIVYNKAPAFLRQAEFYLGEDKFQTAVRAFLKKHEYGNAEWSDLVEEFSNAEIQAVLNKSPEYEKWKQSTIDRTKEWAKNWVTHPGVSIVRYKPAGFHYRDMPTVSIDGFAISQKDANNNFRWRQRTQALSIDAAGRTRDRAILISDGVERPTYEETLPNTVFYFPNYQDYGYGIFLLDDKSRDYVLKNIGREKDDFLRTMMWGSLWDSVREAELAPKDYVELVLKNLATEKDESTIQTLLSRVTTAMNYYVSEPPALAGGKNRSSEAAFEKNKQRASVSAPLPPAYAGGSDLQARLENLLIDKIQNASTQGQRITYYRAFLSIASTDKARDKLKQILKAGSGTTKSSNQMTLKTKDKFDIVTRLAILGDPDAPKLLTNLEKTETSDDAKRYAYAAHAAFATPENKAKFWNDFVNNKDISESWIEVAAGPFNSIRHSELTLPYLEKALAILPTLKRERKIFFVNDWLGDFIGGQRDEKALAVINKFLADNPNLAGDLRLKILENSDLIERAVKIRAKYSRN